MGRYLYSPWPYVLFFFGLTWYCQSNAFFWDTVQLSSKHAHWYYDSNFSSFFLPQNMDSGHPPLWGIYLASCWKIFGKSLAVSHWAVFPFLVGISFFGFQLLNYFSQANCPKNAFGWAFVGMSWLMLDAVFLGQAALVSPDLALILFFLMSLNGIFREKQNWIIIGITGLCLISMRGMMTAFSLCIFVLLDYLMRSEFRTITGCIRKLAPFLPGGLLGLGFLVWHYVALGWIGYHPDSPWADSFERVGFDGMLKNAAVIVWRFIDFGRLFLLFLGFGVIRLWWNNKSNAPVQLKRLAGLFLVLLVFSLPSMLLYSMLSGHRYLLPVFMVLTMLIWSGVGFYIKSSWKKGIAIGIAVAFLSGHFWIYPRQISQQWDATLAHLPYYDQRKAMIQYLEESKINTEEIGTAFPNVGPMKYRDLNGVETGFSFPDLENQTYIYYSNVMNDFSDESLETLFKEWEIIHQLGHWPVETILFKRKSE